MIRLLSRLLRLRMAIGLASAMGLSVPSSAQVLIRNLPDSCEALTVVERDATWSKCRTVVVPIPRNYSFTVAGADTTWTWSGWV